MLLHMTSREEVARLLAKAHCEAEPSIVRIVRLVSQVEDDDRDPVKLLEVNPETSPSGILPIAFAADLPDVPFPSVVVEVTPDEFAQIEKGKLALPNGWRLGTTLFPVAAA
jgi:hypothetical protein